MILAVLHRTSGIKLERLSIAGERLITPSQEIQEMPSPGPGGEKADRGGILDGCFFEGFQGFSEKSAVKEEQSKLEPEAGIMKDETLGLPVD